MVVATWSDTRFFAKRIVYGAGWNGRSALGHDIQFHSKAPSPFDGKCFIVRRTGFCLAMCLNLGPIKRPLS